MDRSKQREWRDLKPLVIALVVLGLVFAAGIAGYRTWQTGSQQHTASQQSNGSAITPQNPAPAGAPAH
ncbi:hypothetical protein ACRAWG_26135 [Methylobacterium sp. P31]